MGQKLKHLGELVQDVHDNGFVNAFSNRFLELRARYQIFNELCTLGIVNHVDSTVFAPDYIATWDRNGKLICLIQNPEYPYCFYNFWRIKQSLDDKNEPFIRIASEKTSSDYSQ